MKNIIYFLVFLCFVTIVSFAQPVIINDTGDWRGKIQADEHGFLVYNVGMWTQYGANFHSGENILCFSDDFSPVITNVGMNHVTCTYDQVGWIWPYGGPSVSDTIDFETRNLIISQNETIINNNDHYAYIELTDPLPASAFPSNGIISISRTVTISDPIIIGISERASWMSGRLSILALFLGPYGMAPSAAAVILDAISRKVDTVGTINKIDYSGTYAPSVSDIPTGNQVWCVEGTIQYTLIGIDILMYDDSDNNGYVPNGATKHLYLPYRANLRRVYSMKIE